MPEAHPRSDHSRTTGAHPAMPLSPALPLVRGPRRWAYLLLAGVFLALGFLGVFLPLLPTTPFLLLMSYFLFRSSPALHERVMRWPVVGKPLREWREKRGVRRSVKVLAFVMVGAAVIATLLSAAPAPAKAVVTPLALIGLYVVWRLPVITS